MSEAIKIKEGGVDRSQNQINKLKTNTVGGGVCFWLPETELQTDDKRITQNGTYTAEEEGLYGYDEITVSVPNTGSVTGRDPVTGNDYTVTVDPETGEIVETEVPSSIRIEQLPTKLIYTDGETINYTGIVVGAYDGHGNRLQEVPFSELVFPVTIAHDDGGGGSAGSDLINEEVSYGSPPVVHTSGSGYIKRYYCGGTAACCWLSESGERIYILNASAEPFTYEIYEIRGESERVDIATGSSSEYETHGKTVYYNAFNSNYGGAFGTEVNIPINEYAIDLLAKNVAWTIIWGNITSGGTQRLPVQWARPGDYKMLDDYFEISVTGD